MSDTVVPDAPASEPSLVCYAYDRDSGALVGLAVADVSPEEPGVLLYPGHTSTVAPPETKAKQAAVWNAAGGENGAGAWTVVPDHRGETWFKADRSKVEIEQVGDPASFDEPLFAERPPEPPPTTKDLIQYAAFARYERETAGVRGKVGRRTLTLSTKREDLDGARNALFAIMTGLRADPSVFKFVEGPVEATNEQLQALVTAALAHVQTCFDVEATVVADIEAGTITTKAEVDAAFAS